jgi:hypothetical protein
MATRILKPLPCPVRTAQSLTASQFRSLCIYVANRALDCVYGYLEMDEDLELVERYSYIKHAKAEIVRVAYNILFPVLTQ